MGCDSMSNLLTVRDVAEVLQCSQDAVIRRFAKMDGVIDLGKSTLGVRRYRVLRIPKAVVERYLISKLPRTDRSGRSISIEVPERAERRRACKMVSPPPTKRPISGSQNDHAC